jgi:hypothetical protein
MTGDTKATPKLSSFAAPFEEDFAAFEALPEDEKRRLIEAEIEKGLDGKARTVTPEDVTVLSPQAIDDLEDI